MQTAEKQGITTELLLQTYLLENLVRPQTARTYAQAIKLWNQDTGISCIEEIARDDVLKWRKEVLIRARAETWNKYRRHLRALFSYAVSRGWLSENLFAAVSPARTGMRLKKTVDVDIVRQALALSRKQLREPAPRLALGHGGTRDLVYRRATTANPGAALG